MVSGGIICAVFANKQGKTGLAKGGLICSIVGIVLGILITVLALVFSMAMALNFEKVCTKNSRSLEDYLYLTGWIFLLAGSIGIFLYLHIILPNLQGYTCVVYRLFGILLSRLRRNQSGKCTACRTSAVSNLVSSTGNLYRCYLWRFYADTDPCQITYRWDQKWESSMNGICMQLSQS